MVVANLLDAFFRRNTRRIMSFDEGPNVSQIPVPAAGTTYLLYLHIPFCVVLCPFCSFHRVEFHEDRARRYFAALRREIRLATESGYCFSELYVGGGTPTVLPDELVHTVQYVRSMQPISRVSAETNPDDLDSENLPRLRDAGVNRLSVGVQSFDDALLREMQRFEKYGSGSQIRARLKSVQNIFDTLNVDMIFNFPHQTAASLQTDLRILTDELGTEQVSFYPLMSADSTRKAMRKQIGEVGYDREQEFYEIICDHMLSAGYSRSSAWCFSRSPSLIDEYITEHEDYLGLGSGAFSYLSGSLYASTFSINNYLRLTEGGASGIVRRSALRPRDRMRYHLLMQLFTGVLDIAAAEQRFAGRFRKTLLPEIAGLLLSGAARLSAGKLRLTERGFYWWVVMMREFFNGVNNFRDQMRHGIAAELALLPSN